ncbi:MAG: histidine kinase N-terminal 7TM domain-containing protein, partial [Candidatus Paceibacterota bacterium]
MQTNLFVFSLPPLIAAIGNLTLGGFVLWKNPTSKLHKSWALFSLCCAIWSFGFFMVYINRFDKQAALFWNHIYSVGMVMIPTAYLYYILVLTESKKKWLWLTWWSTFLIAALITPTIATDLFNKDLILQYWGYSPVRGIAGSVYDITYPVVVLIGTYILIVSLGESAGRKRLQVKYGILAASIGFSLGLTNFFPLYGINIYPLGHVGNLLANVVIAYSIMRYTFMDIDIIIKRGLVYSIMTGAVVGLYVSMIFVGQETIGLANQDGTYRILITLTAIVLIAIVFEPLRSVIQKFVDKRFFKTHYDYREAIKEFSRMVVTILDLDQLLQKTAETIRQTLQLDQVVVFLKNAETKAFEVAAFTGGDESIIANWSFKEESGLVQRLTAAKQSVILDRDQGVAQAVMSLTIDNKIRGFLVLGEKLSGDVYTPNDIDLLSTLADQLSIAVENARLYRAA